jgi:Tol biopolymer transport system component
VLAAAAAVLVGVLATIAVLGDESTVRTRPASGSAPPELVATTTWGALVIVSTRDGRVLRTLTPDAVVDDVPSRSPDGQWVYFGGRPDDRNCRQRLYRARASGESPPEEVGVGTAPAVSPDGTRLAYAGPGTVCHNALVVRTLATGEERSWSVPERPFNRLSATSISVLRWSPDGRHVVFPAFGGLYVVDTQRPGDLSESRRLEGDLHAPAWLPDGRLVALRTVREGERVREQVVVLDPETLDLEPLMYAAVDATGLDVDPSGRFIVVVNRRGDLFVSADRGPLRRLAGNLRTAAW